MSGAVRLVGPVRLPALNGELTLADVSFAGHDLGGGTIKLSPEAKGAARARGRLVNAISVDGRLATRPSGLEGEATLTIAKLPIEPFLPTLPAKLTARGVVSGTAQARRSQVQTFAGLHAQHDLVLGVHVERSRRPPARRR